MADLERILVATDGTESSQDAVVTAAALAGRADGDLHVVTVGNVAIPMAPGEGAGLSPQWLDAFDRLNEQQAQDQAREARAEDASIHVRRGLEESARTRFDELVDKAASSAEIEIDTQARRGTPGPEIVEAAETFDADLLVLGTHGHGFLHRMLLGSISQHVLRHAGRSCLLVPRAEES
ncbi:MAG: universal stress protein [Gemmatimonadetes bacterium]|uniref:Universal stress protein n=1 Tax=Candidatus Kutchimonas denitrificans TaxID=3056748 RepID=A0AAE5CD42_9BACT|nr:universal stress protein [Gemmatimonadota bacterium]NIR76560.1 universal stress protein [Candidatus Kutchimonas denitrificans]NIS01116.1 universal stress protein [Gemmatimonadota bacterium]NIT66883.1 universal stress protein [Gemmatimonadota bacterium]NIU54656.1 universal stress protein [Gemmatimonadota bacterium]